MNPALIGILAVVLAIALAYLIVTVVTFLVANPLVPLAAVAVGAMVVAWCYRR